MARKAFAIPPCPPGGRKPEFAPGRPWLAPMAGYSDLPFRMLCRELGAAVCVTEMISARGLVYASPGTAELLRSLPDDQPLVVQLFGDEAQSMGEAARMLLNEGYAWFDCNLGCPARKVLRQGAGARLLADPPRALDVARAVIGAVKDSGVSGGVGFKLRLGMNEDKPPAHDLAMRLEDAGASWLTLHPRYAREGYSGRARWEHIGALASRLGIPLLASGDLWRAEDGMACIAETGASGVMYARGALRDPYIFTRHLALANGLQPPHMTRAILGGIILRHLELARLLETDKRAIFKMRSIVPRYVRELPGVHKLRLELCECVEWGRLADILEEFLDASEKREDIKCV